jgi:acetolactate synthase I/II/III large subunit
LTPKMTTPLAEPVVGWGHRAPAWTAPGAHSVSRFISQTLFEAGVREAFCLLGGGIAPFSAGLAQTPIRLFHFRHEAGAGFAALEAFFETGRPGVVVVTTGPGLFNVLNPAMAARVDGAKLLIVSGFTARSHVGRGAVQETSFHTMPAELVRPGSIFHDVAIPETVEELTNVLGRLQRGFSAPGGYVAHLGLPLALQMQLIDAPPPPAAAWKFTRPAPSLEALDACLAALAEPNAAIWVGYGARGAGAALRRFAEAAGLPVITSPRAKGVFPESHPLFLGISGAGGGTEVRHWFAKHRPPHVLVVGTRLGEVTSFLSAGLSPERGWLHVDLDPTAFGAAFPRVPGRGIVADATLFFEALHARAEQTGWYEGRTPAVAVERAAPERLSPRREPEVRPPYLMQAIQEQIVARTDAVIMSESGTSFTWSNALLRFDVPGRYRTSAAWGSMGHFTTGGVGAALVGRRTVAIVGDGALLMSNEINTAVQYGANVLWIVLNDAQLGLNEHGMRALGMRPVETQMPRTDFVAFARSQGAAAAAVANEAELEAALAAAWAHGGPYLLDVAIDRSVPPPVVAERVRSLQSQGAASKDGP